MSTNRKPDQPQPAAPGPRSGRIYTRVGDTGQTSLVGKVRVSKDAPRIAVYGTIDEATSAMGMARAATHSEGICRDILDLQGELINLMAVLATPPGVTPPVPPPTEAQVQALERQIDAYEQERIATGHFVRPGGSLASAALDLARTIVRRAERALVTLGRDEPIEPILTQYFNRLSDLLYVMARVDEQREIRRLVVSAMQAGAESPRRQRQTKVVLDMATIDALIEAGMRRANEIGVPMVLAVADDSGLLLQMRRMDNALPVSVEIAPNKAKTAATVRMSTETLARLAQPGEQFYAIEVNIPNLTLVGGGLPLIIDGVVVGGVGASGGSGAQDVDVAQAMVAALA